MSEPVTRPPTPAKTKVSPLIELSNGSLYPYWNLKQSGITPYLDAIRRAFGTLNPFSHQQVPTSERIGLNVKYGRKYYRDEVPYNLFSLTHQPLTSMISILLIMIL